MSKAKIKIKLRPKTKGDSGTLVARVPVVVEPNDNPSGQKLYETKARIITRVEKGKRPKTTRLKRAR